jgi:hypothetical protein
MSKTDNITIDKNLLETLCNYQATLKEIINILRVSETELKKYVLDEYKLSFEEFYTKFSAKGKVKLRENMFNLSKKSPDMAKHLDEKYLQNETENEQITTENEQNSKKFKQNLTKYLQNQEKFNNLPPKKQSFIVYYICGNNGTQSAILAGYSAKTAYSQANRLLKEAEVKELIDEAKAQEFEEAEDEKAKLLEVLDTVIYWSPTAIRPLPPTINELVNAIKTKSMLLGLNAPSKNQFLDEKGNPTNPPAPAQTIFIIPSNNRNDGN